MTGTTLVIAGVDGVLVDSKSQSTMLPEQFYTQEVLMGLPVHQKVLDKIRGHLEDPAAVVHFFSSRPVYDYLMTWTWLNWQFNVNTLPKSTGLHLVPESVSMDKVGLYKFGEVCHLLAHHSDISKLVIYESNLETIHLYRQYLIESKVKYLCEIWQVDELGVPSMCWSRPI